MLWYNGVSQHHILPLIPGSPLTPANEEKIIPHQWDQYQARGSPDTYEMISGVVAYVDEQLGREVMRPEHGLWPCAMLGSR